MKTVLLTGATGFIGGHLLPLLTGQSFSTTVAVRGNFSRLMADAIQIVRVGEIEGNTDWCEALQGIDTVIHLAARAHIINATTYQSEAEFFKVNTQGTINLVRQSIKAGVRHFIFLSSIGAMATQSDILLRETSPAQPDSPYGQSKLQAEQALIELATNSGMTWTIFRPTVVYGAGNPGNMERLMTLIKRSFPLPFRAIKNCRSFLYVGNLVDAIVTCIDHPKAVNQLFLVSDGQDVSTPELIRLIARQIGKPSKLLPVPPHLLKLLGQSGDSLQNLTGRTIPFNSYTIDRLLGSLYVDSSYIQKTLDWKPPFTLEQGLDLTLR
jgi:nucleoside-diphosphate-sugar epimerase